MEDLGKINIEIRESGGGGGGVGGGGGGNMGGGPLAVRGGERGLIRINQAVIHINQAVIQQMQQGMTRALTGAIGTARSAARDRGSDAGAAPVPLGRFDRFLQMLGRVETGSAIKSEMGAFIRSPSAGGLASLFGSSASTGRAVAALGAAALPVAIALGAVLVGVAALVVVYKVLQNSAERVAQKFNEIVRFSPAMMFASATERIAQFQRQIADANKNGAAYARAQQFATASANAQAAAMLHIDAVAAQLAEAWHRLTLIFWSAVKPIAEFVEWLFKMIDVGKLLMSMLARGLGGIFGFAIEPLLQSIYAQTATIAKNTTPQGGAAINNWYTADVAAMTRGYGAGRKR